MKILIIILSCLFGLAFWAVIICFTAKAADWLFWAGSNKESKREDEKYE